MIKKLVNLPTIIREKMPKNKVKAKIFACRQSQEIGKNIANAYGEDLGNDISHLQ